MTIKIFHISEILHCLELKSEFYQTSPNRLEEFHNNNKTPKLYLYEECKLKCSEYNGLPLVLDDRYLDNCWTILVWTTIQVGVILINSLDLFLVGNLILCVLNMYK